MGTVRHLTVVALSAALLAAAPARAVKQMKQPRIVGVYAVDQVSPGRTDVRLKFSARLRNSGTQTVRIEKIWLSNPANTDDPYAQFDGAPVGPKESLELERWITVPRREYERWDRGRPAILFIYVEGWGAGLPRVPLRVELHRLEEPPGPPNGSDDDAGAPPAPDRKRKPD